jgi:hypothetical protein
MTFAPETQASSRGPCGESSCVPIRPDWTIPTMSHPTIHPRFSPSRSRDPRHQGMVRGVTIRTTLSRTGMLAGGVLLAAGVATGPALAEGVEADSASNEAGVGFASVTTGDTTSTQQAGIQDTTSPAPDTALTLIAGIGAIGTASALIYANRRRSA